MGRDPWDFAGGEAARALGEEVEEHLAAVDRVWFGLGVDIDAKTGQPCGLEPTGMSGRIEWWQLGPMLLRDQKLPPNTEVVGYTLDDRGIEFHFRYLRQRQDAP